jgi:hypothetical protein
MSQLKSFFIFILKEKCGEAVDKYIEYELVLVLIDVVLHRKSAFRHLYFNRRHFWFTAVSKVISSF